MITQLLIILGAALILVGFWGVLTRKHIVKIIISFSILDTGIHLIMVGIGYIKDGSAPIIDQEMPVSRLAGNVVDPIPSALVLTAIVIGVAVTALMLSYAVQLYTFYKTVSIEQIKELKW